MWWGARPQLDVLVVCTGNVCRSPYVAGRLSSELPELTIASAGTGALLGEPADEQVRSLLAARGDAAGPAHTARALTRGIARSARVVLTAERPHRVAAVRLAPAAAGRAFTLRELARVLHDAGSPTGIGLDGVLDLGRRAVLAGDERDHDDDLADPHGGSTADYRAMADTAEAALAVIVPALRRTR